MLSVRGSGEREKTAIRVRCGDKINKMKKRSAMSMCEFRFGGVASSTQMLGMKY